jgi:hypothetical protein
MAKLSVDLFCEFKRWLLSSDVDRSAMIRGLKIADGVKNFGRKVDTAHGTFRLALISFACERSSIDDRIETKIQRTLAGFVNGEVR